MPVQEIISYVGTINDRQTVQEIVSYVGTINDRQKVQEIVSYVDLKKGAVMRTLDQALADASKAAVARFLVMVRIDFDSGTKAWHSGFGDITLDGKTYYGIGNVGSISPVKEEPGTKSSSLSVEITGIRTEVVALMLNEPYMNRPAWVHLQLLDDQDRPLIATPLLIFKGSLDSIEGTMGATASFTLSIKSRLADWERPRKLRFSDADQQRLYPGDRGLEYVAQLSQKQLVWPRAAYLPDPRD